MRIKEYRNIHRDESLNLIIVFVVLFLIFGCSSMEKRRDLLQKEHPDCFVTIDLEIVCVAPITGFGMGTETVRGQ